VTALEQLLEVQALDTTADQLRHRRSHLPEQTELDAVQSALAGLEAKAGELQAQRDELARNEKRLEDEIALVREKSAQTDKTLYSGTVNVPRELTALQEEIDALARRQRQLEDQELELMEQAEPLDAELATLAAQRGVLDHQAAGLVGSIAEQEVVIDAELADVVSKRADAVSGIPADLLEEYQQLRIGLGGIAVARLNGNRCEGCHLTLSAVDVDRIRHHRTDELAHCTECNRILVP
jgi:hypothetical protein